MHKRRIRYAVLAATVAFSTPVIAQSVPAFTQADVHFMQGMIGHHAQALAMVALIPARTNRPDLHALGERIRVSQQDEIALMKQWLRDRDQEIPSIDMSHDHAMPGHEMRMPGMATSDTLMPGMLTPEQMTELADAKGADFEILFLRDMIQHHEGALTMVARLLGTTGSGQEPEVFRFAAEVDTDQRAEIARMKALLSSLQPTPTTR
ncbi:MAG TPA: DUF305 domain-containing protein [Gemmatimonadaceae bacterium]|nr:DUF305 domain-containing protein [Gemmatimonadaceae bacterium]